MITFIISAIKIIFLLGFLILIHELGHFTVAKLCKVKVNEFAIGFGPTIWRKQGKETKYALRLFPLGGFVSMEGEEERSEDKHSFSKASIPKRIAIVAAGAIVNIVFAIVIYFVLISTTGAYISNEIDTIIDGYVAQEIGLKSGDKIIEIQNNRIKSKNDLNKIMEKTKGEQIIIKIDRNGEILEYTIKPTEIKSKSTGMYLDEKCKIVSVDKGSSSEKQGIQANDELLKINNQEINGDRNKALQLINQKGINTILLTIKRGNNEIQIELTPDYISNYYLGVNMKEASDTFLNRCINGAMETKEFVFSIIDNLKQLFTGNVGVDQMMGPVGISEVVAKTNGFYEFIYMLALISLSLGITNLLPIPALDGGKILILIIELIRKKPLKEQTEINIQLLGFAILIALSIYVTYNDVLRIF
ncbi:MAG: RIP metalloprotease RseP [Clostridia bacterium]|nr:RIP metalloprotease RseP [Clostridia bacterium]